jgi:alpha-galactosidase
MNHKQIILVIGLFMTAISITNAQEEFGNEFRKPKTEFEKLAQTPPMGWNSWNKFGCNVSESLVKEIADAMVSTGMKDAGYEYVVIDDCWQVGRDENGNILADTSRFPGGMKALADYIHGKGLKFGLYSCAGSKTCQGRPGSRGYQFQDALQYAKWGVDYLKYDWCYDEGQDAKSAYSTMSDALKSCGRPIVLSICEWGEHKPWEWAEGIGHLWRITADIRDCFDCSFNWGGVGVLQILDKAVAISDYAGPGHWNDLEMLEIGNGNQNEDEYRSHMAIWCMMAAPLMAGNDLRNMDQLTKDIICNKEALAIDQDKLGRSAFRYLQLNGIDVLVKPLADGDVAFLFVNRSNRPTELSYNWNNYTVYDRDFERGSLYLAKSPRVIYDVWGKQKSGTTQKPLKTILNAHESLFYRLKKAE